MIVMMNDRLAIDLYIKLSEFAVFQEKLSIYFPRTSELKFSVNIKFKKYLKLLLWEFQ